MEPNSRSGKRIHSQRPARNYGAKIKLNIPDFKSMARAIEQSPKHRISSIIRKRGPSQLPPLNFSTLNRSVIEKQEADKLSYSFTVENPWIADISGQKTLENLLGRPARHHLAVSTKQRIIPTGENEVSFKLDEALRREPPKGEVPGSDAARTREILQREFPGFQYPDLKSTRDIRNFDVWDEEVTPEEWVQFYQGKPGPHGQSPVYVEGNYIWKDVNLLGYDDLSQKFQVEMVDGGLKKLVNRLSIRFGAENHQLFEQRVKQARDLQLTQEDEIRFMDYIDTISPNLISQLSNKTKLKMLKRITRRNRRLMHLENERYANLINQLIRIVQEEYARAMKKFYVTRDMLHPETHGKYQALRLKLRFDNDQVAYYGTHRIPKYRFTDLQNKIAYIHWYRQKEAVQVNEIMSRRNFTFLENRYLATKNLSSPYELMSFYKLQHDHHQQVCNHILVHWREFIISEAQDKMADKYNFFEVNYEKYSQEQLHPLLRRMDLIMSTNVRQFAEQSITDWVNYLKHFRHPKEGICWEKHNNPLIILHLHVEKPQRKKKGDEDSVDVGTIDFKPSIDKAEGIIASCIKWIVESNNKIINLETDLVPFMNFKKTAVYHLDEENPLLPWAVKKIEKLLEDYRKDPIEILEKYKEFEWIGKIDVKQYVKEMYKTPPSIDHQRDILMKLWEARDNLVDASNDLVNLELYQIESENIKKDLNRKIKKIVDALLKRIAKFCEEETLEIHQAYQAAVEKLMTVPTDEDELFALKNYAKNIQLVKDELFEREMNVINHTLILEDFQSELDPNTALQLWNCKAWPTAVDISVKDGKDKLDIEEEKFRDKLDKEKETWHKDVYQLALDFEKIQQFDDFNSYSTCFEEVARVEAAIKDALKQLGSFNQRETLFEIQLSDKTELTRMMENFQPYMRLWTNVNEFRESQTIWMAGRKIQELNATEITSKTDLWHRECFMLQKKLLEQSPEAVGVITQLKSHLEEFQENLPLITALSNEALKDDHWKQLSKICNLDGEVLDPKFETVESLNQRNLHKYIEEIEALSHRAQREHKLRKKLEEMQKQADVIMLEIIEHKDTFKIRTTEDIQNLLDEQIVNIQAMKTSPYAKPIERSLRDWEVRLQHVQETLEEWIKCQRVWMNLEPIFSSEDIIKQMPQEARMFKHVDTKWRTIMDQAVKESNLMECVNTDGSTLQAFQENNDNLDAIQKKLNLYLEHKRLSFARFFFLSDEDLIDILSQTKDPLKVQNHLSKCFEAIDKVVFSDKLEITTMLSPEKESMDLIKKIAVNEGEKKGNVDLWMGELEDTMFKTVREIIFKAIQDYQSIPRNEWVIKWQGMVVLCVGQIYWTQGAEQAILDFKNEGVSKYEQFLSEQLMEIVELVRGNLSGLARKTLGALVTLDVHARDIITKLKNNRVSNLDEFDWIAQLRYYVEPKSEISVRMVNSSIKFGFEYLGNSPRLVITPLTDRCYRTLIGAYYLYYGGAPEGPAGTGKTESVKDLAKAVAVKCVVFNCSDNLDYKAMGKFFKGLASSGSWCCFDEFNRIFPEVLSVIAMQLQKIQNAIRDQKRVFEFEGTTISLVLSCAVNITMNPGYAGRSQLPDNLKALFRTCAMMVPNYAMISEISLFAYGFKDARKLAGKIVASLRLSSEQLSTQKHYDFGMRAVKAILVACGNLKMKYKESASEEILGIRALMDVNVPKFTSNDIPLFLGITNDLFPGVTKPDIDYGELFTALDNAAAELNLQPKFEFRNKCIQLYETILVRHGLMLVGATLSGKSMVIETLQLAMSSIPNNPDFVNTVKKVLNPKSITQYQLFGRNNPESQEWTDGVLANIVREYVEDPSIDRKWVVFDGPVDAIWIENMNTVLDDNKMLCLSSGEIIKLTDTMTMMFEVEDLKEASPATVSRCGMVYLEPEQLGLEVFIDSYVHTLPYFLGDYVEKARETLKWVCYPLVEFVSKKCHKPVPVTELEFVVQTLNIFDSFIGEYRRMLIQDAAESPDKSPTGDKEYDIPKDFEICIESMAIFSVIWGIGASTDENTREKFSEIVSHMIQGLEVKDQFGLLDLPENWEPKQLDIKSDYLFNKVYAKTSDYYSWVDWMNTLDGPYIPHAELNYQEIIVPTKDTIAISFLTNFLQTNEKFCLFSGPTGTAKTISILNELINNFNNDQYTYLYITFSAQTKENDVQQMIDNSLDRRYRGTYGPPANKTMIIFVDDLNMPQKDTYGSQPPIELLRQWMDTQGWYDLDTKEFRKSIAIQFCASMGPPSGGRNHITQRYLRHFNKFYIEPFNENSLKDIFGIIVTWFFNKQTIPFSKSITDKKDSLIAATIHVFQRTCAELLPTPSKSHYLYNLRDVSKVFQGISQTVPLALPDDKSLTKIWVHECQRIFQDRLISYEDRQVFEDILKQSVRQFFKREWDELIQTTPLLFGDFLPMIKEGENSNPIPDIYCELSNLSMLKDKMEESLEYFNQTNRVKMNLVLFMAAIETIVKVIRIIKQPNGNALLVGVGGSGRKSASLLAASISDMVVFEIEVTKGFGMSEWREQMIKVFLQAGVDDKPTVFILNDGQIANEGFLEDINNMLNNGDIPNLLDQESKQIVADGLKDLAIQNKKGTSPDAIHAYFIERVRKNLHLSLCLSPIGDSFRRRLRMFPSLVSCTTINWFLPWPKDALYSVAQQFLEELDEEDSIKQGIIELCVDMQERVTDLSHRYQQELRRFYYVTPTSYLELIYTFTNLLGTKRVEVQRNIQRYENGLEKILTNAEKVAVMQKELEELQPQLIQSQEATKKMMEELTVQQDDAAKVQEQCEVEEANTKEKADQATEIKEECEAKLAEALPTWRKAIAALKTLTKNDLVEIKSLQKAPDGVVLTIEAVCKLVGIPPIMQNKASGFGKEPNWLETGKKHLFSKTRLLEDLESYDKDNISPDIIANIEPMINNPNFVPEKIAKSSKAANGLCMWVRAMYSYDQVMRIIRPKQAALAEANERLRQAEEELAEKKENLRKIQEHVAGLQQKYEQAVQDEQNLQNQVQLCSDRLTRASQLIDGLSDEKVRWAEEAQKLKGVYTRLVGDLVVSSGIIAYLGIFTGSYRSDCIEFWTKFLIEKQIPCSETFNLTEVLGNNVIIGDWVVNGLPNDDFSIDNAIILQQSKRWPLMIDPQLQANNWIKKMEKDLKITRLNKQDLTNTISNSMNIGLPVLIENIGETINPELDQLMSVKKGSQGIIRVGDKEAEMTKDFRLYITTKYPRPHYSPEICVRLTILNFLVTEEGLRDQMLSLTISKEARSVEEKRQKCIEDSAKFNKELKEIEDNILELLNSAEGEILDNQVLIETLQQSKVTSKDIQEQLQNQVKIQKTINETRRNYYPVAFRVSKLFFVIADLCNIEPMYQYSLEWYQRIYITAIDEAEKSQIVAERVHHLIEMFTELLYDNTCRSLYVKDKLLFSLLMLIKILQGDDQLDNQELRFLMTGSTWTSSTLSNPTGAESSWLSDKEWAGICELATLPTFKNFELEFMESVNKWKELWLSAEPMEEEWPKGWKEKLQLFQQIIVLRLLRPDKVVQAVEKIIQEILGDKFINPPDFNLEISFKDANVSVPLIFILSPGQDPISEIQVLAAKKGFRYRMNSISLGDGQGKFAEAAMDKAIGEGGWVVLQNCHLATSWMPTLERLVEEIDTDLTNPDFRLWLTSAPSETFPVSILQNGIKITNEAPKGLKNNMIRSYLRYDEATFEECKKPREWKRLLYSLSFFHASVQERRKFGPLGWNNPYEFSMNDLDISVAQLRMFLDNYEAIPWDALQYMVAEANYGGRVTDKWDRRTITTILKDFYNEKVLTENNYKYSPSGRYIIPPEGDYEHYIEYLRTTLPANDQAEVYGLHENAAITSAINETNLLLDTCLSLLPKSTGSQEKTKDEILTEKCIEIMDQLPRLFDIDIVQRKFQITYNESMNTVLIQELIRYNNLLAVLKTSTAQLKDAIAGLVIMSADLEEVGNAFFDNRVPELWKNVAYPSLKPLGFWLIDFLDRMKFMNNWIDEGAPNVFWISGFFFTQSFLTGTSQNYARRNEIPIDTVRFDFEILKEAQTIESITSPPQSGCYVYGLFLDGARWDDQDGVLSDPFPKILYYKVPIIWIKPCQKENLPQKHIYKCPVYKTSARFGVLSTTGHSTNFVLPIKLPMQAKHSQEHWIKRGAALITQLDY